MKGQPTPTHKREQVFNLAKSGKTNSEIANETGLPRSTVTTIVRPYYEGKRTKQAREFTKETDKLRELHKKMQDIARKLNNCKPCEYQALAAQYSALELKCEVETTRLRAMDSKKHSVLVNDNRCRALSEVRVPLTKMTALFM